MTPLQQQYPLNPRKFWKKMLSSTVTNTAGTSTRRGGPIGALISLVIFVVYAVQAFMGFSAVSNTGATDESGMTNFILVALFAVIIVLILWFGIKAWYVSAYIRKYFYDASDSFITIRKGVFTPTEIHVQWQKVQDVYVDQDFLDRMLGLYDVHLASATATSGIEAHIDGVDKVTADGLKAFLLDHVQAAASSPATSSVAAAMPQPQTVSSSPAVIPQGSYQISGTWLALRAVSAFILMAVFAFVLDLVTFLPAQLVNDSAASGTSILDTLGVSSTTWTSGVFVFCAALFLLQVAYNFIWRSSFALSFSQEYIVLKQGVISRSERHVPYRTIQDVTISQSFWGRILGIATVAIQNATQGQGMGGIVTVPGLALAQANDLSEKVRNMALSQSATRTGL